MSKILVTGATGNVGSRLVRRLKETGRAVRAFARDLAGKTMEEGVEAAPGDFMDKTSLQKAMDGVTAVYLLSAGDQLSVHEANAIEAAKAARVKLVVKHSVAGAQYNAPGFPSWHRAGEERLEASGIPYVFLRPVSFASNALYWAGSIKDQGTVYGALGDAAVPVIDPEDIAEAAGTVLTTPGHEGKAYELSGPEALTTAQQVDAIGRAVGRDLKYVNVPDDAARQSMLGLGMSPAYVEAMISLFVMFRGIGRIEPYPNDVQTLTGHKPRSFSQWAETNAAAFQ
ncbi:MAG TPA: SDR family oxidoreductase [Vicinamibacterales bacterium]|nr:SDR family oxidoreductase [Vicinamibacterales bacterium]